MPQQAQKDARSKQNTDNPPQPQPRANRPRPAPPQQATPGQNPQMLSHDDESTIKRVPPRPTHQPVLEQQQSQPQQPIQSHQRQGES